MVEFYIGVDGGGTSTRAVLARASGPVLGRGDAGPSALGQGIAQAWENIRIATARAFAAAGLEFAELSQCALGAGLSGVSHTPWREAFLAANPGFAFVEAESDAFTMLLGAHEGRPGAIVIAGTGSIGEALRADGTRFTVGGWGFPVGDEGSGAWLGLQAIRHAQAAMDGRSAAGPLARQLWRDCGADRASLQAWCAASGQFAYAQCARLVFEYEASDEFARDLLDRAAAALESIAFALDRTGRLPLAMAGSIAQRLVPRLSPALRERLVQPASGPEAGALGLIRRQVAQAQEAEEPTT